MRSSHSVSDVARNRRVASTHTSSSSSSHGPPLPSTSSSYRGLGADNNSNNHNDGTDKWLHPSAEGGASIEPMIMEGEEGEEASRYPRNSHLTAGAAATGTELILAPSSSSSSSLRTAMAMTTESNDIYTDDDYDNDDGVVEGEGDGEVGSIVSRSHLKKAAGTSGEIVVHTYPNPHRSPNPHPNPIGLISFNHYSHSSCR